jgi:hypothetical protein
MAGMSQERNGILSGYWILKTFAIPMAIAEFV